MNYYSYYNMNRQYIDIRWLTTFGLSKDNILEYFYTSDFYDTNCNNQIIRNQGVSLSNLLSMEGIEYTLDAECTKEPNLYVITKSLRKSPKESQLLQVFYCLNGIIYQSPYLLDHLKVKFAKFSYNILESFDKINNNIEYTDQLGHILKSDENNNEDDFNQNKRQKLNNLPYLVSNKLMPSFESVINDIDTDNF